MDVGVIADATASQDVHVGETIELTVTAAIGGAASFAWSRDGVPLIDGPTLAGSLVSGATTPMLAIDNAQLGDAGQYSCLITSACGSVETSPILVSVTVACPPDLDGDSMIGPADLAILLAQWGMCPGDSCPSDLTGDGVVDAADLAALLAAWGPCV
jgi:hypothetical protein